MKNLIKSKPEQAIYNNVVKDFLKDSKEQIPIKKGCKNPQCYCTGECQEVIGYRDKLPNEN